MVKTIENNNKERIFLFFFFPQTRISGLHRFGWNSERSCKLVLLLMEIKLVLWNNFSHLGREYKGLRKHVTPFLPKYKQEIPFAAQPLLGGYRSAGYTRMLKTRTSNTAMNRDTGILGELQLSSLSLQTQWNLKC